MLALSFYEVDPWLILLFSKLLLFSFVDFPPQDLDELPSVEHEEDFENSFRRKNLFNFSRQNVFSATENVEDSENNPDTLLAMSEHSYPVESNTRLKGHVPWFKLNFNFSGKDAKSPKRRHEAGAETQHNNDFLDQFHSLYEQASGSTGIRWASGMRKGR